MRLILTKEEADLILNWYSWIYSEGAADEKDGALMLRIKERREREG